MNKGIAISLGVLAAAIVVAYFAVQGRVYKMPTKQALPTPAVQESTPPLPPETPEGAVREIMVSGNEYKFSPATISLTKGETVKILFRNMGKLPHNLTVTELGVSTKTIPAGAEDSVTVTADKTGMYSFFCSVSNHRQLGMEGKVEVK